MKTIWKFELEAADVTTLNLPRGTEILTVQAQRDRPQLWALLDPKQPLEPRVFVTVGTGHPFPTPDPGYAFRYVATWQAIEGRLVFHTFELVQLVQAD